MRNSLSLYPTRQRFTPLLDFSRGGVDMHARSTSNRSNCGASTTLRGVNMCGVLGMAPRTDGTAHTASELKVNLLHVVLLALIELKEEDDRAASARYDAGKDQLERLISDTAEQGCWANAVEKLKAGCKAMDDDQRSHLAVLVRRRAPSHRAAR